MPAAAASPHGPPQAEAIAWRDCADLECASVRVPLDWDRPGRAPDQARGDPPPGQPARKADRLAVRQPRRARADRSTRCRADPESFDALGGGRFDVVGWDIRGAGASTHVRCFRDERSRSDFFRNWSIPTTRRASRRYVRKTARLARRCGRLSGRLLRHMSTADTARDLDYLRRLVGDRRLTLPRHLRRHVHRPDLREHVPAPGARDGPRRRPRPRPLHAGHAGQLRPRAQVHRPRLRRASCLCAKAPDPRAARSPATAP